MSDLERYQQGGGLSRREQRAYGREIDRLQAQKSIEQERLRAIGDVQAAKVHEYAFVANQALHSAGMVSERALQLGHLAPHARGRLEGLADLTTLGFAEILDETRRKLGR